MAPNKVVLPVPDIKVPNMPFFSMPKLGMPKTDVPSPPTFNGHIRLKDVKVVPDTVVLRVLDIKVPDMPFFLMPKLSMPKTDVPSPPTFNVPVHPPPKPAASLSLSVPEFKVLDAAPKFDMPKVVDPLFSMPKFDIPNMPTFALPRWTRQN